LLTDLLSAHGKMKNISSSFAKLCSIFVNNNFEGGILVLCHHSCYGNLNFFVVLVNMLKTRLLFYVPLSIITSLVLVLLLIAYAPNSVHIFLQAFLAYGVPGNDIKLFSLMQKVYLMEHYLVIATFV
jgi:hypothetical protein